MSGIIPCIICDEELRCDQREVVLVIDIEKELMQVQIKHIQKELEQLRLYYDDIADLKFLQIICSYEEMIELATTMDERLLLYKKMYQDSLAYIFNEIQNTESAEDFDGIDNENSDGSKDNDKLPF